MNDDACYRALVARDARFDGTFFVGVTTTGIYCRPVCRARTPGRSRCVFFRLRAQAEREGYRACFRCRPEIAPGSSSTDAVSSLARAAAHRIEAGALNDASLDDLARELGTSARHVRRAVHREVGVSPLELAQSCRLALAKQLLHEGSTSITSIAHASGFSSVRRFNAAFRERFDRTPSSLKKHTEPADDVTLTLGYRDPFAWRAMLQFLAARATPGVEIVDTSALTYARTVRCDDRAGWIRVSNDAARRVVIVSVSTSLARSLMWVATRVRALFDLDADPRAIDAHLARDATLRPLVRATPGTRVPGAFDTFEIGVRVILGQQVSVRAATTFAGRLALAFGDRVEDCIAGLSLTSPTARTIAAASPSAIAAIGITSARARTLCALAAAFTSGRVAADSSRTSAEVIASLESVAGIGPWTAQAIAMRALRAPDAFPAGDLALARSLSLTPRALEERATAWSPWRAYAVMHLWSKGTKS